MEFAHLLEVMMPSVPVNEVTRKDLYGWNLPAFSPVGGLVGLENWELFLEKLVWEEDQHKLEVQS